MSTSLTQVFGKTKQTMTPSGRVFLIRETNGNDDDILSNPVTQRDLSNYDNFLSACVLKEIVDEQEIAFTIQDVNKLLLNDRTHLLFAIRIHTIGGTMKFEYNFGDEPKEKGGGVFPYTEDLEPYLHDYTKPFPQEGEEGYFKYKIPPYPKGCYSKFEITIESGKQLRFNLWNRESEKSNLALPIEAHTKNSELLARNLEINMGGEWIKIENFSSFNKREMVEIHAAVNEVDNTSYIAYSDIEHPITKEVLKYPILASTDFFFPREI